MGRPELSAWGSLRYSSGGSGQGLFDKGISSEVYVDSLKLVAAGALSGQVQGVLGEVYQRAGAGPASLGVMHDATPQGVGFESDQSLMYLAGVDEALQEGSKGRKEAVLDIRKPHRNCQLAFWSDTWYRTLARSKNM